MLRSRNRPGVPFSARSSGIETRLSTSSAGWPENSVMTCTWVSVGSGKASTVSLLKAYQPPAASTAARTNGAIRFFREYRRSASSIGSGLRRRG